MTIGQPNFSATALQILEARYLRRDEAGNLRETPEQMLQRVAAAIAVPAGLFGEDTGYWQARFYDRMNRLEFLPNSPTLMNAGLPKGQLAACFVLPIADDLDSIFETLNRTARIHQTGGGTGFSFSHLRPRDDPVCSTGGVTSGPLPFMELFDHTTAVIRQGGRRRGANMAVLRIDHPDIEEFIDAKRAPGRLENFNLSVAVTDAFWEALAKGNPFALVNPRTASVVRRVDPQALFQAVAAAAWATGDPGLLFMDEINRANPTPLLGTIEATNPCGEQPLLAYESCTLGSVNLAAFAAAEDLDWRRLGEAIHDAIVFLDNVIEANHYPFSEIDGASRRTRKIGLGVMGFADLLARVGIPYDSDRALDLAGKIARFIDTNARAASVELGQRRGSFPALQESVWPARGFGPLRNAALTCIAPTGTISLIAGVSSGIEPFFALACVRRMLDGRRFVEVNSLLEQELVKLGGSAIQALDSITKTGSARRADELPEQVRRRFPVALEIAPIWHLRMQAAFQAHMDAAVSKTVNLPQDASVDSVQEIFALAHDLRLKGVTIYRYGTRAGQVLSLIGDQGLADCRECAV